ncbi:MAG: ABC transporter ATP-binding protein [Acidimicrobiia bacterium]|nr:ABC transporter ATP-binding protein [Acidimicrobiia bacterium]
MTKRYGDRLAVDGLSFAIRPGERYGLLGPNGAGKTTTISMVCGVLRPDDGTVLVDGQPAAEARGTIGYVPQDVAVFPDLTARENLAFFGRLLGLRGTALRRRTDEVLETVELADRATDFVVKFSGGLQRRLNIAIGLLAQPRLLVLDEPTVGLDPQARNGILEAIERLAAEGVATLYTTHHIDEAARLCTRLGIVDHGRLIAEGSPAELVAGGGSGQRLRVAVGHHSDALVDGCRALPAVVDVVAVDGHLDLTVDEAPAATAGVLALAERLGVPVTDLELRRPDLETVFLGLTGRALRD